MADIVDHGFTAAVNFRPQPIHSIRDFILDQRICEDQCPSVPLQCLTDELLAIGRPPPFENEGLPSPFKPPTAAFAPTVFYSHVTQTIGDATTEDWTQPVADPDSLCALLGDLSISKMCRGCETVSVLIAASSQDWCLKELDPDTFYRERCVNPTDPGNLDTRTLPTNVGVDMVFCVDESSSMADARNILQAVAAGLETNLNAAGVGNGIVPNRFGVVAFGHENPATVEVPFTNSAGFITAAASIGLPNSGPRAEDAYEGIDYAINKMPWRDAATVSKVIFFITDEDRNAHYYADGADQTAQFASLKAQLVSGGFVLAGMFRSGTGALRDHLNALMIASDYTGKCYAADGAGGFTESTGAQDELNPPPGNYTAGDGAGSPVVSVDNPYPTGQKEEYYDLVTNSEVAGYFFDLNRYREGGFTDDSVIAVIVPALTDRITQELTILSYTSSVGSYVLDGYDSIIRFAPLAQDGALVILERFGLKGIPAPQTEPSLLHLRIGISGQTADPNTDRCVIVWRESETRKLACVSQRTAAEHTTAHTQPSQDISWRFFYQGKNVCVELKIAGTGGDCILSGSTVLARSTPARNF